VGKLSLLSIATTKLSISSGRLHNNKKHIKSSRISTLIDLSFSTIVQKSFICTAIFSLALNLKLVGDFKHPLLVTPATEAIGDRRVTLASSKKSSSDEDMFTSAHYEILLQMVLTLYA
ncbi:PREDICTED: uncharacterized protein LOC108376121, partial [Rhagoletis zephyria]|uniref:uncharacterized protein LOC108376121 n=1 Tax=Rhagoletis zephyria TaxID=28612 RepID=UPI0008112B7D